MRGIGQETAVELKGLVQAGDHAVQGRRQLFKLISRGGDGQPLAEVARGDALGAPGDFRHRPQGTVHQRIASSEGHDGHHHEHQGQRQQEAVQFRELRGQGLADFHQQGGGRSRRRLGSTAPGHGDNDQFRARRQFFTPDARLKAGGADLGGIKTFVRRRPGLVEHRAAGAENADESSAGLRRKIHRDFRGVAGGRDFAQPCHEGGHPVGAGEFRFGQRLFQIAPHRKTKQGARGEEDRPQPEGVPQHQPEAQRTRVHSGPSFASERQ